MKNWSENYNPIKRLKSYLHNMKYWNDDDDVVLNDQERMDVIVALETVIIGIFVRTNRMYIVRTTCVCMDLK
jgi:hypothetical protein